MTVMQHLRRELLLNPLRKRKRGAQKKVVPEPCFCTEPTTELTRVTLVMLTSCVAS